MKKLDSSAAALTLAAFTLTGAAVANDGTADAPLTDWAVLDQEIQALSATLQGTDGGISYGGRIRAFYENSGDVDTDGDPMNNMGDLGGFSIYNARLYAHGTVFDNIGVRLEVDFAGFDVAVSPGLSGGTTVRLLDALIDIPVAESVTIRTGQFRPFVMRASQIDSGNLFFADRSMIAALFSGRSQGVAAHGNFDLFNWAVTIQNGSDGVGDELFYALRGEFDILGEGTDLVQGAYGAGEDMEASVGAAYFNDDTGTGANSDMDGIAIDGSLATSRFSFEAGIVDLGDMAPAGAIDINERWVVPMGAAFEGNSTPFTVQGTVMLTTPSEDYGAWELGARFQDMDSAADTRIFDIGLNYYAAGHDMKYILNWTSYDTNTGSGDFDGDVIRLGLQTRF